MNQVAELDTGMIGHNLPRISADAVAEIKDALRAFDERRASILKSARNVVVRSKLDVGAVADIVKVEGQVWERIDLVRKDALLKFKEAYDAGTRATMAYWKEVVDEIDRIKDLADTWTREEDKRIADQRAEQAAEDQRLRDAAAAANPVAPAPVAPVLAPVKRAPIRGDLGGKIIQTTRRKYHVVSVKKVPAVILNSPKVHEAICAVAAEMSKHLGEDIAGLGFVVEDSNSYRKR